jgi:hypothetical protein
MCYLIVSTCWSVSPHLSEFCRGVSSLCQVEISPKARQAALLLRGTILPFLGHGRLTTQITSRKIAQCAEWRRTTAKGTTVKKELACIRHMMQKAEEWGQLASSTARKIKDLRDDGQAHKRYSIEPALQISKAKVEASSERVASGQAPCLGTIEKDNAVRDPWPGPTRNRWHP